MGEITPKKNAMNVRIVERLLAVAQNLLDIREFIMEKNSMNVVNIPTFSHKSSLILH